MTLDDDALNALWSVYDATGVRPEYLLPVLYYESGFDPARSNALGSTNYGIAQTSAQWLAALGTTPAAFLAMTAGQQIRLAVAPYFKSAIATGGPIRSAVRAYQANFLPATLPTARALSSVLTTAGSLFYRWNPSLDAMHHGYITLADLALVMGRSALAPAVRAATARAYALRPSAGLAAMLSPVYGADYLDPFLTVGLWALVALAVRGRAAGGAARPGRA
jgi:hypothetical protein